MKLYLIDMDEVTKYESSQNVGHPTMSWSFAMLFIGRSGIGKTNLLANFILGDKSKHIYKRQKGRSGYIKCDDLIVCDYHLDELKGAFVRYMYRLIASNSKASYYENIRFSYISPERIPNVKSFSSERNTIIIFENLCMVSEHIQNRIIPFFTHGRYQNISPYYVTQKYHYVPMIIHENISFLVIYNTGSNSQDVSKIIGGYTDDVKDASMVINSYLCKGKFVVFDLTRPEDDPLAIRLRFDTSLNLQKEIEARQKRKEKSASTNE